jgi:2-polyprenyl-6-methoxyphenol hydroxylase-like FAD-dependent oxidoreductase
LVLALWLTRLGVAVRIVDKTAAPGSTSRALAVQVRTLEFYRQLGIAKALTDHGRWVNVAHLWVSGKEVARLPFGNIGHGLSAFPGPLIYPQDEHEKMLVEVLAELGVNIERCCELLGFREANDRVIAQLRLADGIEESIEVAYIAGCDGAHSRVRSELQIGFPGGTYEHLFYVADVEAIGEPANGDLHVALDRSDFLAVFPMAGSGRVRLVGTVREEPNLARESLQWDDVSQRVVQWLHLDVKRINWLSTYRVHHRVAERFREGRAFLLGDAAHIHSPAGGQGMNTGIGDAVNLAWKLAAVLKGRGAATLLDSYEPERIAFARRLVKSTDRGFRQVTSSAWMARQLRLVIVPHVAPWLLSFRAVRRFMFRTISQIGVSYPKSALSEGHAGRLLAGQRLPWVSLWAEGEDNHASLASLDWQVHVYGDARAGVLQACRQRGLLLRAFAWNVKMQKVGLVKDAVYLIRPDGHIAFISAKGGATALLAYLDRHEIAALSGQPARPVELG